MDNRTIQEVRDNETKWINKAVKLQQEKNQLKEDFAVLKKLQMISNDILNELEEWLKDHKNLYEGNEFQNNAKFCMTIDQVLDKIQELKEMYK